MRNFQGWALALGTLIAASGCGNDSKKKPAAEPVETACGDGADNDGDAFTDCDDLDCRMGGGSCALAPALDRSVASTIVETAAFLYSGTDPLQKDVNSKAFDPRRIAIVRGRVVDSASNALTGVRVSVLGHSEYGWTRTRPDGVFDMAVNGGSRLVFVYEGDGLIGAERGVTPGWQRYAQLPTVGLIAESATVSKVKPESGSAQIAVGDEVDDGNGARQPFVLFQPGTTATITVPDGSEQSLSSLSVHVTEYPFEASSDGSVFGPGSMPNPSVHYGLELSVEQAADADATEVRFSNPVSVYVDNFLKLPIGAPVPVGYYNRIAGQWRTADGGRVIEVLDTAGDAATVDVDGDGAADDGDKLESLGITAEELGALGKRAAAGSAFWRARVSHFSPWVMQLPISAPAGASAPPGFALPRALDVASRRGDVMVESQVLGQSVAIAGTPYSLRYQTNRTMAYGPGFEIDVPLVGDTVPDGLKGVTCTVEVAGEVTSEHFDPAPNLHRVFDWDGKDAFGRELQGLQTATVTIGYEYDGVIRLSEVFGAAGGDLTIDKSNSLLPIPDAVLTTEYSTTVGLWDARGFDLGGFALDVLHSYDPAHQTAFYGYGDMRSADNVGLVVSQPAKAYDLGTPDSMASAPDGSVLVTDDSQGRVLRIDPHGDATIVAGPGANGPAGDLQLTSPQGIVETADGTILVADYLQNAIRDVHTDGSVDTLVSDLEGDNPVVQANLDDLDGIALGPREELYIVNGDQVLRYESGSLSVFAGGGDGADGGPATLAQLAVPSGLAVAADGSVFISERDGNRVREVSPDGTIHTVAGTGTAGFSGDGAAATSAELNGPRGLALGPDGALYIADQGNNRIRRVTPDGIILTIVGGGDGSIDEGQLPSHVALDSPDGIALGKDGSLYIATYSSVFKVSPGLPEISDEESLIPSQDGQTLYKFDHRGKHEATLDAMTGVTELSFAYDDSGRITSVRDVNGLTTTIERNSAGAVSAIVAPFGQRTTIALNADGAIETVTDAIDRSVRFSYENGLLSSTTDPKGGANTFHYDPAGLGRLIDVTDPTGYKERFEGKTTGVGAGRSVTVLTPQDRPTEYALRTLPGGVQERGIRNPDQSEVQWNDTRDPQVITTTSSDGTKQTQVLVADPQFGTQSPSVAELTTTLPSGRSLSAFPRRSKTVGVMNNALSLEEWTEHIDINDRAYESTYKRADGTFTTTTPMGRTAKTTLDTKGRPTDWSSPGLPSVHWDYDTAGHVIKISRIAGNQTRTQTFGYDTDRGFLANETNALSETSSYDRDDIGRVLGLTRPDAQSIGWDLDKNDNVIGLSPPGRSVHRFDYDSTNLLTDSIPPSVTGATSPTLALGRTHYAYDQDQNLSTISRSDGKTLTFGYDPTTSQLETLTLGAATLSFGYDGAGKLTSVNRSDSVRVDLTSDGPLWTGTTWSGAVDGSVTADYDQNFWLSSLTVNNASTVNFSYDSDGLVTGATGAGASFTVTRDASTGFVTGTTLGNVSTDQGYNGWGELDSVDASYGASSFNQAITRDELGRVTHLAETIGTATHDLAYTYDTVGRLETAARDGTETRYTYDANGNRTSVSINGTTTTAAYDAQDRILSYGAQHYEQSAQGDLFRRTDGTIALELTYDELGDLMKAYLSDGTTSRTVDYVVDGFGRRVARKLNGTFDKAWLYRDALRPIAQIDASGTFTHFVYTGSDSAPDFMLRSGVAYRLLKDHIGSVRVVVNAQSGAVAQQLDYDELGRVLGDTNPGFQPFGFAGGLYDPDTKLVRFGARDYDPGTGRWTSKDPIGFAGGDTNVYVYVGNDPVNFVDPTGLKNWSKQEVHMLLEQYAADLKDARWPYALMWKRHNYHGKYDFALNTDDTFEVTDVGRLDAAQFGNFIAGFAAGYLDDPLAYWLVRGAGAAYGIPGWILAGKGELRFLGDDKSSVHYINTGVLYAWRLRELISEGRRAPATCK